MRRPASLAVALLLTVLLAKAQTITRHYDNVPLPKALMELNDLQQAYTINFIYDELEDFRVSTSIEHQTVTDAIRQMIGFYPIRVVEMGKGSLLVECTQKTSSRYKGTIVNEQGRPIPYANIVLLSLRDSAAIAGGVSNEAGLYVIPCEATNVLARYSHIGYKTLYKQCQPSETGKIRMQPETHPLQETTIEGQMPILRREAGTMIFDARNITGAATAVDLLRYTPGILVTGDDATLFGSNGMTVCINGKEQHLGQKELWQMLSSFPARDIERIEIIQTPGAKYAAAGHAGVVNLVLKQKGNDYIGGTAGYEHTQSEDHGDEATASVTYNKGKVSASLNVAGTWDDTRYKETDDTYFTDFLRHGTDHGRIEKKDYALRWQIDWSVFSKLDCGAYVMYADRSRTLSAEGGYNLEPNTFDAPASFTTQNRRKEDRKAWAVNVNASQQLNDRGAKIDYNLDYYRMRMEDGRHSIGGSHFITNHEGDSTPDNDSTEFNYQNHISLKVDNYSAKADLSSKGFKLGLHYAHTHSHRDLGYVGVGAYGQVSNTYDERLLSGYAEYGKRLSHNLTVDVGGRYEHIWTKVANRQMENADRGNYGKLFPSLHADFKPRPWHTIDFTLGSSITRPNIININTDWVWRDVNHVSYGNQNLKPSYVYKATMGYSYKGVANVDLYYTYKPDRIEAVYMVDKQVTYNSWDNATDEYNLGINAYCSFSKLSWVKATLAQSVGYKKTVRRQEKAALGFERTYMHRRVESIACKGSLQVSFFLGENRRWSAYLNATYSSPKSDVARHVQAQYKVDAGMQYRFWNDRATLALNCRNLIASRIKGTEYLGATAMDFDIKSDYRQLRLTLSYNWGARLRHKQQNHESDKMQERIVNDF